jgi:hypothetical protein
MFCSGLQVSTAIIGLWLTVGSSAGVPGWFNLESPDQAGPGKVNKVDVRFCHRALVVPIGEKLDAGEASWDLR